MDILENDGLLKREQGRGTFVADNKINRELSGFLSVSEDLNRAGFNTDTKVIHYSIEEANKFSNISCKLGISSSDELIKLKRLKSISGTPAILIESYLPSKLFSSANLVGFEDSLYEYLKQNEGIIPQSVDQTLEGVMPTKEEANLLNLVSNTPLLRVSGTTYDNKNREIEYFVGLYRADKIKFHLTINREEEIKPSFFEAEKYCND